LSKFFIMCIKRSSLTAKIGIRRKQKFYMIDSWAQFHQRSRYSFYARRSQKCKKTLMTWLYFLRFWDLRAQKLYVERWWNWHLVCLYFLFQLIISFFVSPYRPLSHKANFHYCQSVLRGQWLHSIMKQDSWMWKRVILVSINILIYNIKKSIKILISRGRKSNIYFSNWYKVVAIARFEKLVIFINKKARDEWQSRQFLRLKMFIYMITIYNNRLNVLLALLGSHQSNNLSIYYISYKCWCRLF